MSIRSQISVFTTVNHSCDCSTLHLNTCYKGRNEKTLLLSTLTSLTYNFIGNNSKLSRNQKEIRVNNNLIPAM